MGQLFAVLFTSAGLTLIGITFRLKVAEPTEIVLLTAGSLLFAVGLFGTIVEGIKQANREISKSINP